MHYHPRMSLRRLSTTSYDDEARIRLAKAVVRAREAAGFKSRPTFAAVTGVSIRSLADLEQASPRGVGQRTLHAVARALPGWDEDTPRHILDGGEPPQTPRSEPVPEPVDLRAAAVTDLASLILTDAPTSEYLAALGRWQARLGETTDMREVAQEAVAIADSHRTQRVHKGTGG